MSISPQDISNYSSALQTLENALDEAYWSATSIQAKDQITAFTQNISDILTSLNQAALDQNSAQYAALEKTVDALNAKLQGVQSQINAWIHILSDATAVTNAIDQALATAAKVFAA